MLPIDNPESVLPRGRVHNERAKVDRCFWGGTLPQEQRSDRKSPPDRIKEISNVPLAPSEATLKRRRSNGPCDRSSHEITDRACFSGWPLEQGCVTLMQGLDVTPSFGHKARHAEEHREERS